MQFRASSRQMRMTRPEGQIENLRAPCFASNCLIERFAARPAGLLSADKMRPAVCRQSFLPSFMRKAQSPAPMAEQQRRSSLTALVHGLSITSLTVPTLDQQVVVTTGSTTGHGATRGN